MKVRKMNILVIYVFGVIIVFANATAHQSPVGKGVFGKHISSLMQTQSIDAADEKQLEKFFSQNRDTNIRAPAHDTPASPCKCSEFLTRRNSFLSEIDSIDFFAISVR